MAKGEKTNLYLLAIVAIVAVVGVVVMVLNSGTTSLSMSSIDTIGQASGITCGGGKCCWSCTNPDTGQPTTCCYSQTARRKL